VRVRRASPADIPALAELAARAYRAGFAAILEEEALAMRPAGFFAEHFSERWDRMMVAADGERALGFTLVTEGHIDMLFVDPLMARSGIGTALLEDAERHGAASLECFRDNAAARAFYERHGWQVAEAYSRPFLGRDRAFVLYRKNGVETPR
jgi:putative acetyltransferase